jgi:hypothetical protein
MGTGRQRIKRVFLRPQSRAKKLEDRLRIDRASKTFRTKVDFSSLKLPSALSAGWSEAFWSQAPARSPHSLRSYCAIWTRVHIYMYVAAQFMFCSHATGRDLQGYHAALQNITF